MATHNGKIGMQRSDKQLKILKKRDDINDARKMDEVSNHQLPLKNMKSGDCISRDKKMENLSHLQFLPKSVKTNDCINQDKVRQERADQNLWSKSSPMIYYTNNERSPFAAKQTPLNISRWRNSSCMKEGGTMRPNIGSFNSMKSPDGIPSEHSPRWQGSGSFNRKEGGDETLNELPYEPSTRISLESNSSLFNYLDRQERGTSASGIRYPPYLSTIGLDAITESSRIYNETPRKNRRIKSSWTKSKISGSRLRDKSDSLNHAKSPDPDHEPDAASSSSRSSSPATVGRNFMDYLIANYSDGIFNPHRNSLASKLSPDPKQSFDPNFVPGNQSALSSSSYNQKAPKPITAEENNNPHHCSHQGTCIARKLVQSHNEAKPIRGSLAKMSDRCGVKKMNNRKTPAREQAYKSTNTSGHDMIWGPMSRQGADGLSLCEK